MFRYEGKRVIFWDVDGLLGQFHHTYDALLGVNQPEYGTPDGVRSGIVDLLKVLTDKGIVHFATSSGPDNLPNDVLEKAGLRRHFEDVFNGYDLQFDLGKGKHYAAVAEIADMYDEAADHGIVIIGDNPHVDMPADIRSVFIFDRDIEGGKMHDAETIGEIVSGLLYAGDGSFLQGFETLFATAEKVETGDDRDLTEAALDKRVVNFGGVACHLFYADRHFESTSRQLPRINETPVIEVLANPHRVKPLDPIG